MSDYRLSVRAIIITNDKIMLNEFNNGEYYNLPGGGLEIGETLRDCVEREVYEESGYRVKVYEMLYIYEYNPKRDSFHYGSRGALSHVFKCEIDLEYDVDERTVIDSNPKGTSRSTGCKWIPVSELSSINLVPRINDIILKDFNSKNITTNFLEDIH